MSRRVWLSDQATRDLVRVRAWYTQPGSGERARNRLRAIAAAIRELANDPLMWPVGQKPGERWRIVERHTIVYEIEHNPSDPENPGDIVVLHIFGPGQCH
jgi:plasmid stabilization system protein ParE